MRKAIITLLEIDEDYYDTIVLHTYVDWCMGFTYTKPNGVLQQVLINKGIQRYFKDKYSVLEQQFLNEMTDYIGLSKADKNDFYAKITNAIFNNYPGALIPKLKSKNKVISN